MDWKDDPEVWDSLDELMMNVWPELKTFLDALNGHKDSIDPMWQTMTCSGLGQLVAAYNGARMEANNPQQAYAVALEAVIRNPQFSGMLQGVLNGAVDGAVQKMEDSA